MGVGLHRTRSWPRERFFHRVLRHYVVWGTAFIALNDLARLAGLRTRDEATFVLSILPGFTWTVVVSLMLDHEIKYRRDQPRDLWGSAILLGVFALCILWYFAVEWYRTGTLGPLFA